MNSLREQPPNFKNKQGLAMAHIANIGHTCGCGQPGNHFVRRAGKWFCGLCIRILIGEEAKRHEHLPGTNGFKGIAHAK